MVISTIGGELGNETSLLASNLKSHFCGVNFVRADRTGALWDVVAEVVEVGVRGALYHSRRGVAARASV